MNWVNNYYSTTGKWWGPAEANIRPVDTAWAELVKHYAKTGDKKVLELGAGYGGAAAATANLGFDVTAVELSDRIDFGAKHVIAKGSLKFIKGDFYEQDLDDKFDIVTYWDGFGVGNDSDNRRVLSRVATDWLTDDGIALVEVYNPIVWASWDGDTEERQAKPEAGYNYSIKETNQYDPVNNRFVDTWHELSKPDEAISQNVRCYSPADFLLLLEGTGLQVVSMKCGNDDIEVGKDYISLPSMMKNEYKYLVVLRKQLS